MKLLIPICIVALAYVLFMGAQSTGISLMGNSEQNYNGNISPLFPSTIQYWASSIQRWANEKGIDPNLASTVMLIESCGNKKAHSPAGANGLFQVMPFHFSFGENSYDPDTNANRGLNYLKETLTAAKGNVYLALAGYNGGIGKINMAQSAWPQETKNYVYWGNKIYIEVSNGNGTSLNQWINNNGAGLCREARKQLGIGN